MLYDAPLFLFDHSFLLRFFLLLFLLLIIIPEVVVLYEIYLVRNVDWSSMSQLYSDNLQRSFACLRRDRFALQRYLESCNSDFRVYVRRPDTKKQQFVDEFVLDFNCIEMDMRFDEYFKCFFVVY